MREATLNNEDDREGWQGDREGLSFTEWALTVPQALCSGPFNRPSSVQENLTVTEFSSLQSVHEEPNSWASVFNCTAHF